MYVFDPPEPRADQTLPKVLARRVARCGDRPWIVHAGGSVSYREMDSLSNRFANGLRS